jgi:hypothetical protein
MRPIHVLFLATISALCAGPAAANCSKPPLETFTGRLEFAGEFQLFANPASGPSGRECVSGAFPLQKHLRAKRLYRDKLVRIKGRKVPYSSLVEQVGTELGWKGAQIPNYCGGQYVILAEKAEVIKGSPRQ